VLKFAQNQGMNFRNFVQLTLLILLLCSVLPQSAFSQIPNPAPSLSSPRDAVYTHLYFLQSDTYNPANASLPIFGVTDPEERESLAIKLKQVLDGHGLFVYIDLIPDDNNYMDSLQRTHTYVLFPRHLPEIYLERIDGQWYYSRETVNSIQRLHDGIYPLGSDFLINLIPRYGQVAFLGLFVWQWTGIALILLVALIFHFILTRIIRLFVKLIAHTRIGKDYIDPKLIWRVARVLSLVVTVYLIMYFVPSLQFHIELNASVLKGLRVLNIFFLIMVFLRIADFVMIYFKHAASKTETQLDDQLMPIVDKLLAIIIVIGGILHALQIMGVNITALVAGVGIGGLAIALAAQDTVRNLIGSVLIFVDQPFQIGDFVTVAGVTGTIEEVGFRSTRIRTVENSLVSVPNGKMMDTVIDNLGLRKMRRFKIDISLTYDTPTELMNLYRDGLHQIIEHHPATVKNQNVFVNDMQDSAITILAIVYLDVNTYTAYLKARHELLIQFIDLARKLGVRFAFPSRALYMEEFPERKGFTPKYEHVSSGDAEKVLKAFLAQLALQDKKEEEDEAYHRED
jgi:MscS family membrane protein